MIDNLVIKRSQLVEAQITGTAAVGKRYQFTEVPNISRNNIIIYGFEAFTDAQLDVTPNNNNVIASTVADQICITLVDNDNQERIYQLPYYTAIRSLNYGFVFRVKPLKAIRPTSPSTHNSTGTYGIMTLRSNFRRTRGNSGDGSAWRMTLAVR